MDELITIMERRQYQRYEIRLPLKAVRRESTPGLTAGDFDGQLLDLSRSGLRFSTREMFHRNEVIEIMIYGAPAHPGLRCEVRVVRSRRVPGQRYEVAGAIRRLLARDNVFGPLNPAPRPEE